MREIGVERMFLPTVENNPKPRGEEYSQIWHLFAYRPDAAHHLAQFTPEIMRSPAPVPPGIRELIPAYTSYGTTVRSD